MSINKSLSSLTDVFTALGNKSSHVPYRNSKLTYLLQPCLSGDGKTLMVVNLSPTEESHQETVCSLRFAQAVNKVELGKSKKTVEDLDESGEDGSGIAGAAGSAPSTPVSKKGVAGGVGSKADGRGRPPTARSALSKSRSRSSPSKIGQHKR